MNTDHGLTIVPESEREPISDAEKIAVAREFVARWRGDPYHYDLVADFMSDDEVLGIVRPARCAHGVRIVFGAYIRGALTSIGLFPPSHADLHHKRRRAEES